MRPPPGGRISNLNYRNASGQRTSLMPLPKYKVGAGLNRRRPLMIP
jgi:hypothetical protein